MDDFLTRQRAAISSSFASLLPQQVCRSCQKSNPEGPLCKSCHDKLTHPQSRCYRCAHPLSGTTRGKNICGECLKYPPAYERIVTAADYQEPVNQWINRFKHQRDLRDGHLLSSLLLQTLMESYADDQWPELLIPVPLHWRRTMQRSFNQASWISHCLQKNLKIPAANALKRTATNHTQQGLGRQQRLRNLKGAFSVTENQKSQLQGKHIALVDDVVTTTSTARTLSALLQKAGTERVDVWCLARTAAHSTHCNPG